MFPTERCLFSEGKDRWVQSKQGRLHEEGANLTSSKSISNFCGIPAENAWPESGHENP